MKAAIEAAKQALSSAPKTPCKTFSPSTARSLAYVWARMAGRYGALWTNSHGEAPGRVDMGEWGEVVGGLTEDEIRAGFAADLDRKSDFPPSSARFRGLCLGLADGEDVPLHQRPGADMYRPVAPRSRRIESDASRAAADREMAKLRKLLRVSA